MSSRIEKPIVVYKGRTTKVTINLGVDVSTDTLTSEIRVEPNVESTKIAEWDISFITDGTDGKLLLTLDDSVSSDIEHKNGYMDIKRVSGGEPLPVFDEPIPVIIKGTVTE